MFSIPFQVRESMIIAGSLEEVFSVVSDFSQWSHWSPWLCQNPKAKIEIQGEASQIGHRQRWAGEWIGAGENEISYIEPLKSIDLHLRFRKPWKSRAEARFEFSESDQGVEVVWSLQSSLPIFLFFMKKMMVALIASDYMRGLIMLKDYIEKKEVTAQTAIPVIKKLPSFHYVGQKDSCTLQNIGSSMEKNFAVLYKFVEESLYPEPDFYLSIYHKFDLVKGACEYTAAMGYYQQKPDADYLKESGKVPEHESVCVVQMGEYKFLGNAWAAARSFQRYKKLKMDRSIAMYEKYVAVPPKAKNKDIRTEICVPVT